MGRLQVNKMQDEKFEETGRDFEEFGDEQCIEEIAQNLEKIMHFQPRPEFNAQLRSHLLTDLKKPGGTPAHQKNWKFARRFTSAILVGSIALILILAIRFSLATSLELPASEPVQTAEAISTPDSEVNSEIKLIAPTPRDEGYLPVASARPVNPNLVDSKPKSEASLRQKQLIAINSSSKEAIIEKVLVYRHFSQD